MFKDSLGTSAYGYKVVRKCKDPVAEWLVFWGVGVGWEGLGKATVVGEVSGG